MISAVTSQWEGPGLFLQPFCLEFVCWHGFPPWAPIKHYWLIGDLSKLSKLSLCFFECVSPAVCSASARGWSLPRACSHGIDSGPCDLKKD